MDAAATTASPSDRGVMLTPAPEPLPQKDSDRVGPALKLGHKKDMATVLASNARIWFWTGVDRKTALLQKLQYEWQFCPFVNLHVKDDAHGIADTTNRMIMIYISGFFTDGSDFIFFVKGYNNMSKFLKLSNTTTPYDSPCVGLPVSIFGLNDLIKSPGLFHEQFKLVSKTCTKGLKWRFLYRSAVKVWSQLQFSDQKYKGIENLLSRSGAIDSRARLSLADVKEDNQE